MFVPAIYLVIFPVGLFPMSLGSLSLSSFDDRACFPPPRGGG